MAYAPNTTMHDHLGRHLGDRLRRVVSGLRQGRHAYVVGAPYATEGDRVRFSLWRAGAMDPAMVAEYRATFTV